jgi:hypothetical protein
MPDVPHELIARRVEHVMDCHGELDDAEPCADVAARSRADIDEGRTHLVADGAELIARQRFQIGGKVYRWKGHQLLVKE